MEGFKNNVLLMFNVSHEGHNLNAYGSGPPFKMIFNL